MLDALGAWLTAIKPKRSVKSELAGALRYALAQCSAATFPGAARYPSGPQIRFFAGSDAGGGRAAAIYSLIEAALLNDLDFEAYLRDVLATSRWRLGQAPAAAKSWILSR